MSDFLVRDWEPFAVPGRSDVKGWIRDDRMLLVFELRDDTRRVTVIDAHGKVLGTAELREKAGAAILVPASHDPDVIKDALWFWPRHPSIHLAALALSARILWPTKEPK